MIYQHNYKWHIMLEIGQGYGKYLTEILGHVLHGYNELTYLAKRK
jgi:hypothetical protein